jgi:UDPglucose 6-dehydrogenase
MDNLNLGIIGYGYVGKSMGALFERSKLKYHVYDTVPKIGNFVYHGGIKPLVESRSKGCTNVFFICVPTPSGTSGECNTSIIERVLCELSECDTDDTVVVIKSTVYPGFTEEISAKYNFPIVFCPEFLRESSCIDDVLNSKFTLLGLPTRHIDNPVLVQMLTSLFGYLYGKVGVSVYIRNSGICETFKYTINVYLAVKVWYFNEIYQVCSKIGVKYDNLHELFHLEPRIGTSHTNVPGHDGKFGYGLSCLPKETRSLCFIQEKLGIPNHVLANIINRNEEMRKL